MRTGGFRVQKKAGDVPAWGGMIGDLLDGVSPSPRLRDARGEETLVRLQRCPESPHGIGYPDGLTPGDHIQVMRFERTPTDPLNETVSQVIDPIHHSFPPLGASVHVLHTLSPSSGSPAVFRGRPPLAPEVLGLSQSTRLQRGHWTGFSMRGVQVAPQRRQVQVFLSISLHLSGFFDYFCAKILFVFRSIPAVREAILCHFDQFILAFFGELGREGYLTRGRSLNICPIIFAISIQVHNHPAAFRFHDLHGLSPLVFISGVIPGLLIVDYIIIIITQEIFLYIFLCQSIQYVTRQEKRERNEKNGGI